jgi:uncharacterized protein YtpQ (UPF0354 family)
LNAAVKGTSAGLLPVGDVQRQPADLRDFQAEVLDILKRKYPAMKAVAAQKVDVIEVDGGLSIGLLNIHATVRSLPAPERRAAIGEFLDQMMATASRQPRPRSWAEVEEFVFPRLMSTDVFQVAPDLLHRPFGAGVIVGYVIDHGPGVAFINRKQSEAWDMPVQSVDETAVANLEALSMRVHIDAQREADGPGLFAGVDTNDSYDAARILLPKFRSRLLAALGDTIFVGIPYRDFLFAWSPDATLFENYVMHVRQDFRQRARPITDTIFVIDRSGVRPATAAELRHH